MITLDREAVLVQIGKDGDKILNATVKELTVAGELELWKIVESEKELSFVEAYYRGLFDSLIEDCVDLPEKVPGNTLPLSVKKKIFAAWREIGGNSDFFQSVETRMAASVFGNTELSGMLNLLNNGALSSQNEDTDTPINTEDDDL